MQNIDMDAFTEHGLFLLPEPNASWLILTRREIESRMQYLLNDPSALPPETRAAADYQACEICPERDTAEICHAIMTLLPFMTEIDQYLSYQKVLAVYREPTDETNVPGALYIRQTQMQEALQFISILSLMFYCEVGKKYYAYFENANPLMPSDALSKTVFANMYIQCLGNREQLQSLVSEMTSEILLTAQCQVKRLRLICKNDALINAIVGTHTTVQMLLHNLQDLVDSLDQKTTPGHKG